MVDDRSSRRRRKVSAIAQAYRDSNEVMSAALAVALFAGGGYWLDLKYGWKPVFMICGLVIGSFMATVSLRRLLIRLDKQSASDRGRSSIKRSSEK